MAFLKLVRFLCGYVRFIIIGEIPERLINQLAANHISVWNTVRRKDVIEANILARDYKKIRKIRGRNKVKTRLKRKYGLPFFLKNYSKRVGIVIGAVVFIVILNFLSSKVWYIKVEGNDYIPTEKIISIAEKQGLKIGVNKNKINSIKLKNELSKSIKDSAWIAVNVEGAKVTLKISENLIVPKKEKTYPCNLVAIRDGVITKILVKDGVTKVQVNQAVQRGELLVSGTIEYLDGDSDFKHSMGEVFAKTEREIVVSQKLNEKTTKFTGEIKNRNVLSFFGINIPLYLGSVNKEFQKELKVYQYNNGVMSLPISLHSAKFMIKKDVVNHYSKEQAKKLALLKIEKLEKDILKDSEILNKEEKIIEYKNSIKIIRNYECIENIAKEEKIKVNTTN